MAKGFKGSDGTPTVEKRSRNFCLITYLTEDDLVTCLNNHQSSIRGFEYIFHDQDVKEDGTPKEPHFHVNLILYNTRKLADIRRWFFGFDLQGLPANTLGQICLDIGASHDYLTHKDNPEKFQYNPDDIVSSDSSLFERKLDIVDDVSWLALNDMLEGVPLQDIAKRYGRDFIYHYGHIKQVYVDIVGGFTLENRAVHSDL